MKGANYYSKKSLFIIKLQMTAQDVFVQLVLLQT